MLASNSPRRRELLSLFGLEYAIRPAPVDETPRQGENPAGYVRRLADEKAWVCARTAQPEEIIIAADTTVTLEGEILGKPQDAQEAAGMLRRLRGRHHQVCTATAVMNMNTGALIPDLCVTDVPMRNYSEEELLAYAASGDPLDKAGGYAIQHPVFRPVDSLQGCHASVMGLPLCHLGRSLEKAGITPTVDFPAACQSSLGYNCPIHARVRNGEEIG